MDLQNAMSVIESCAGFTDDSTPAGEAWSVVQAEIERLRAEQSPITDWRVRLVRPEPGEPFGTHVECRVIDISYSDKVLLVKEAGG